MPSVFGVRVALRIAIMIVLLVSLEILFWVSGVRRFSPFKTISLFGFYNNQEVSEPERNHGVAEGVARRQLRDKAYPSVRQQSADYPGDGGDECAAVSDAGKSERRPSGELEAEGGEDAGVLLPGRVCGDGGCVIVHSRIGCLRRTD